jgi:hypothetical protein
MKEAQLKCDNPKCDWAITDDPHKWYKKKCPKCKVCVILNDKDMNVIKGIELLERLGVVKTGGKKTKGLLVQIDTANLRK